MRNFVFGFLTGVGATLGGVFYAIGHVDSIDEKLNEAADYAERQAVKMREKSANPGTVRYEGMSPERRKEIDGATIENPVTITVAELQMLDPHQVNTSIRDGRLKLDESGTSS